MPELFGQTAGDEFQGFLNQVGGQNTSPIPSTIPQIGVPPPAPTPPPGGGPLPELIPPPGPGNTLPPYSGFPPRPQGPTYPRPQGPTPGPLEPIPPPGPGGFPTPGGPSFPGGPAPPSGTRGAAPDYFQMAFDHILGRGTAGEQDRAHPEFQNYLRFFQRLMDTLRPSPLGPRPLTPPGAPGVFR